MVILKIIKEIKMHKELDKYYTSINNIKFIINKYKLFIQNFDIIIEPSAGDGRFIEILKKEFPNKTIIGFDILPEHKNIIKKDFLSLNINDYVNIKNKKILIIGNPPYGKNAKLAFDFIFKAFEITNEVIFILSKTFISNRYKKKLDKKDIYIKNYFNLPEDIFYLNEKKKIINTYCIHFGKYKPFNKYTKTKENNQIINNIKLQYTKDKEKANFVIRRVGGHAGKVIDKNIEKYSLQSNYFIICNNKKLKEFLIKNYEKLNKIAKNKTLTNPSLSKKDLENFINKNF